MNVTVDLHMQLRIYLYIHIYKEVSIHEQNRFYKFSPFYLLFLDPFIYDTRYYCYFISTHDTYSNLNFIDKSLIRLLEKFCTHFNKSKRQFSA